MTYKALFLASLGVGWGGGREPSLQREGGVGGGLGDGARGEGEGREGGASQGQPTHCGVEGGDREG